jgi:hypothetical protein
MWELVLKLRFLEPTPKAQLQYFWDRAPESGFWPVLHVPIRHSKVQFEAALPNILK